MVRAEPAVADPSDGAAVTDVDAQPQSRSNCANQFLASDHITRPPEGRCAILQQYFDAVRHMEVPWVPLPEQRNGGPFGRTLMYTRDCSGKRSSG
jgi:hypothetical protein